MKPPVIILARGGSKGIPNKNLLNFCGRPLIAWTIAQAAGAENAGAVYVSSDSDRILQVAASYGAKPIKRPADLAQDTSSAESALLHALQFMENDLGRMPDCVIFLQATSPVRESTDIDQALEVFLAEKADSLFSASLLEDACIWERGSDKLEAVTYDPENRGRRQDREPLILENGSIYIFRPRVLHEKGNRLGGKISIYLMPFWKSHEIDVPDDVGLCEYYFRKHLLTQQQQLVGGNLRGVIKLVIYDFDGVMTDNRAVVDQHGVESVIVNRADGLGIKKFRDAGVRQLILSTEANPVVGVRAKKLGVEVIQDAANKMEKVKEYAARHGIGLDQILYVGNDINDLDAMKIVGWPAAPNDAHPDVLEIAKIITAAKGGEGVVKELAEHVLD